MSRFDHADICAIIPARNEEATIAGAVSSLPAWVNKMIVVDNGSTDASEAVARKAGAAVVSELTPGYGRACLVGIREAGDCEILVFLDGDGADDPNDLQKLLEPIPQDDADFVVGLRISGDVEWRAPNGIKCPV
ncbi:MAG: glycosyltransferase family 2 protein [Marinicaulis sp.]|nr:glycosyltransferase family 2 protein [Marinicaulis sp.]